MPVYSELVNPDYKKIKTVIAWAMMTDYFFYTFIAIVGYVSTFNFTNTIVTERPPLNGKDGLPRQKDIGMLIGNMGICIIMIASVPVNYHPFRH